MMQPPLLLVEILTEELPPKSLKKLSEHFAKTVEHLLAAYRLTHRDQVFATPFATPRRLALLIQALPQQPDIIETIRGPNAAVFFDADAKPDPKIAAGFAKRCGVDLGTLLDGLITLDEPKGSVVAFKVERQGKPLGSLLEGIVREATAKLPVPKMMRWGEGEESFVRPVRGLVMLHGDTVVPGTVFGCTSGRETWGHRFMGKARISIPHAERYQQLLNLEGKVIADFLRRKEAVQGQLNAAANGAAIAADDALYDEVTALVEWPVVYGGSFDAAFLEVPQPCLMLTMQHNQKYFPLLDAQGKLLNRFLLVSNIETADPGDIIRGNERVLKARLADAKFFYDQDRKRPLHSLVPQLAAVMFHNKLGSQLERVERIERLAGAIAIAVTVQADQALAQRAARLAKADLLTGMVGEFPELQGTMGKYYAQHDGEDERVAAAIEAHYRPRQAGGALPEDIIGDCVALADKLDTLVGIWGIGLAPTGDKDPFALRRAALGALRILAEHSLKLDLIELLELARAGYSDRALNANTVMELMAFMLERLRGYLRDRGFAADEIETVVSQQPRRIDLVLPRLEAVRSFRKLPEAAALAAANKRIQNILKKAESIAGAPDAALLQEDAEIALHEAVLRLRRAVDEKTAAGEYAESLQLLAQVRQQVDTFFDKVLVNAPDAALRDNRLRLLTQLEYTLNQVADISKLAA